MDDALVCIFTGEEKFGGPSSFTRLTAKTAEYIEGITGGWVGGGGDSLQTTPNAQINSSELASLIG